MPYAAYGFKDLQSRGQELTKMASNTDAEKSEVGEAKGERHFHVDTSRIRAAQLQEQSSELQGLAVHVYNQDEFEQGVLDQVDDAIEAEEEDKKRRELEKDLRAVQEDMRVIEQELEQIDGVLQDLEAEDILDRVTRHKLLSAEKQKALKSGNMNRLKARERNTLRAIETLVEDMRQARDRERNAVQSIDKGRGQKESAAERAVRLGEMTPFGTLVNLEGASPALQSYLTEQHKRQARGEKGGGNKKGKKKNRFDEKDNKAYRMAEKDFAHLPNSKSKYTPLPHNFMSDEEASDGAPDNDDTDDVEGAAWSSEPAVPRQKKRKLAPTLKRHNTTGGVRQGLLQDDEEEEGARVGKERDDGSDHAYRERIKRYRRAEARRQLRLHEAGEQEPDDVDIGDGFSVPAKLWSKLFKFQRTGVRWLWELHQQQCGGILGDEMGLGKTVQAITFLAALRHSMVKDTATGHVGLGPVMVVAPATVLHQWVREFHIWCPPLRVAVLHSSGSHSGSPRKLLRLVESCNGILVTSYSQLLSQGELLRGVEWHYVILDEGHKIRNPDAQVTVAAKQLDTPHRIILSGSPMQNNFKELWSLFDFVFPGKLGDMKDFLNSFSVPIVQGGYVNATPTQVQTAYRCACVLRDTINPYLLRRMKDDVKLSINLPTKNEQVLFCRLTKQQRELYTEYLDSKECHNILAGRYMVFPGLTTLRKLCNHPDLVTGNTEHAPSDEKEWGAWQRSGKMVVLEALLKLWHNQGHKVLLFSQSVAMLKIMQVFVERRGYTYLRLDGGTPIATRQPLIAKFNKDPGLFVFLLTTRVGGLGVNLTGANRVVIFDPDWNPSTDTQARERAWRIGQNRHVTIYRLMTAGTIEEKIYHRQIFKQFLTNRVLKDPKQRRFFKSNDLFELFTLDPEENKEGTETSAIFSGTGATVKLKHLQKKHKLGPKTSDEEGVEAKRDRKSGAEAKSVSFASELLENQKDKKLGGSQAERRKVLGECTSFDARIDKMSEGKGPDENLEAEGDETGLSFEDALAGKPNGNTQLVINRPRGVQNGKTNEKKKDEDVEEGEVSDDGSEQMETSTSGTGLQNDNQQPDNTKQNNKHEEKAMRHESSKSERREKKLREMARKLSQKLAAKAQGKTMTSSRKKDGDRERRKERKEKHKEKSKHRRREKHAKVEGSVIPGVVKSDVFRKAEEGEEPGRSTAELKSQDDYVLGQLLAKTGGVQSALRHDVIMDSTRPDFQLVEQEAERVAKDAVRSLRKSRAKAHRQQVLLRKRDTKDKPRFGRKSSSMISTSATKTNTAADDEDDEDAGASQQKFSSSNENNAGGEALSAASLLASIRARRPSSGSDSEEGEGPSTSAGPSAGPSPGASLALADDLELLDDIRTFVAFGAAVDGQASTGEVLTTFGARLPPAHTAKFKAMLRQLCDFERRLGVGVWRLKQEFR